MAYRLTLDDDPSDTVRHAAREQLAEAAALLVDGRASDPVTAVHGARKNLKKARALLRLVRPALDADVFRSENAALSEAGRTISGARDADVLRATLDDLADRAAGRLPVAAFDDARARVGLGASSGGALDDDAYSALAAALDEAAARAAEWPLDDARWADARSGLHRAYRDGRAALRAADADPSVEHLHEWRKRVKDLWYHQRLLHDAWPAVMEAQAEELDLLSEALGDDHDLAMLEEALARAGRGAPPGLYDEELRELVRERRAHLQEAARRRGARVYAEPPKRFARRMGAYLRAGVREGREVPAA